MAAVARRLRRARPWMLEQVRRGTHRGSGPAGRRGRLVRLGPVSWGGWLGLPRAFSHALFGPGRVVSCSGPFSVLPGSFGSGRCSVLLLGLRSAFPLAPRGFCGKLPLGLRGLLAFGSFPFGLRGLLAFGSFPFGLRGLLAFGSFPFGSFPFGAFGLRGAVSLGGAAIPSPQGAIPLKGMICFYGVALLRGTVLWRMVLLCSLVWLGGRPVNGRTRNSPRSRDAWQERIRIELRILV
jgi:hypothetical protein